MGPRLLSQPKTLQDLGFRDKASLGLFAIDETVGVRSGEVLLVLSSLGFEFQVCCKGLEWFFFSPSFPLDTTGDPGD